MSTSIFYPDQIQEVLRQLDPVQSIEDGFVAYSQGLVTVPPVGELIFEQPPGDMHIKYGCIRGDDYFVVKIATGFYDNAKLNLPTGSGLMLIFSQKTGALLCVLLDEGHLTNVRTAAAGAVVARYLAPRHVQAIGILGVGVQGRMQLQYLKPVTPCREVVAWGITRQELDAYERDMEEDGFRVRPTLDAGDVAAACNLIVTATPSQRPLLHADQIRPGTHITAMGSDTADKIELDPEILRKADLVVADSLQQSCSRGEIYQAVKAGAITRDNIVELGTVIQNKALRRSSDSQVTVADLTGVAVQDIQIAKAVFAALSERRTCAGG